MKFWEFYDKRYKQLLIIPILLIVLALGQLAFQYTTTGSFVNKGVDLSGGTGIDIARGADVIELQALFEEHS